ncbi:hypothetical protein NLL50_02930 [Corynebacterium propinquum]|uniref:hypothetical protein n=1 Tax=Corynebacterium propinquum TaxID=43769 RepID=UPI0011A96412|nr:hypothetical protein [Corynebacterium propinquum]MDK4235255.1 hypothetical protein [Corynebacterium propinquum]MDK4251766.1 hypothetical protein [Corynebacterium propinquum]MDK4303939.1 hypothetical protein [Corynebacterium propinquum]WKS34731.1 hypothetical protein NLL50_02930 [Corynebacterium propinquum]WKS41209.1 hypothetical protein NLL41_02935 [Corynebacterium propinquum]
MVQFIGETEGVVWAEKILPFSIAAEHGGWLLRVPKDESPNPEVHSLIKSGGGGVLGTDDNQYFIGSVGDDFSSTRFYENVYDFYRVDDLLKS